MCTTYISIFQIITPPLLVSEEGFPQAMKKVLSGFLYLYKHTYIYFGGIVG